MNPYLKRIRGRLIGLSLLALFVAGLSFALSQWLYASTDDQCTWRLVDHKVRILEILPEGVAEEAGLLEGDELLAIQGRKVKATQEGIGEAQALIDVKEEGTVLSYTIRRDGELLQVPVRLVKRWQTYQLALLANGLIFWMVSLLVVISSPERKSSRHFFYLGCGALLMGALSERLSLQTPTAMKAFVSGVSILVQSLLPPLWVHFFTRFPHPFDLRRNRRFLGILYGGFLSLTLFQAGLGWMPKDLGDLQRRNAILSAVRIGVNTLLLCAVAAGLVLFVRGIRKLPAPRRALSALPLIAVGAVLLDLSTLGLLGLIYRNSLIFQRKMWIFMAALPLLPLSFGYAIIRHGLFDVRRALIRWVAYFALSSLAVLVYLGLLFGLFHVGAPLLDKAWLGVFAGLLVLPMGWLLRAMLRHLRRAFRRDHGVIRDQILGALRESSQRLSEHGLIHHFEQAVQEAYQPQVLLTLGASKGVLPLPSVERMDDEGALHLLPATSLSLPSSLLRHARDHRELVVGLGSEEADWIREQDPALRVHLDAMGLQLMVLLMAHEEPHTALLLGGKYAELGYGREDRELLREGAIAAGAMLETVQLHQRVVAQERAAQELATARRIQESLLPQKAPDIPGFQVALRLEPALETGGDLLFLKRRPSGRWIAAVGDVSGKGLAAALYMSQAIALLELAACQEDQPLESILARMDHTLRGLLGQRGFLTLALIEWDEQGHYRLARAGHPGALLMEPGQEPKELIPHGRGLGLRPAGPGDWEIMEGMLPPRAWIVLYSDGLTEAMDRCGELFGLHRLGGQLKRLLGTGSVRAACEAVFHEVAGFESGTGSQAPRSSDGRPVAQNRDDRTLFILGREAA